MRREKAKYIYTKRRTAYLERHTIGIFKKRRQETPSTLKENNTRRDIEQVHVYKTGDESKTKIQTQHIQSPIIIPPVLLPRRPRRPRPLLHSRSSNSTRPTPTTRTMPPPPAATTTTSIATTLIPQRSEIIPEIFPFRFETLS